MESQPFFGSSYVNYRNVEYILLAEFDIITGSTVKHQFPYDIGVDDQMLAEFMLPDGAHKREDDWTVFFLNRPDKEGTLGDSTQDFSAKYKVKKQIPSVEGMTYIFNQEDQAAGWAPLGHEKNKIELGNSIVIKENGKEIFSIKKNQYLELSKMDDKFIGVQDTDTTAVGIRFDTPEDANKLIAHVEHLKEEAYHEMELAEMGVPPQDEKRPFLYCLNLVRNKRDSSVARGSVLKSMAICTRHHFIDVFRPYILLFLDKYYKFQSVEVLSELYFTLNSIDLSPVTNMSFYNKMIYKFSSDVEKKTFEMPLPIPSMDSVQPLGHPLEAASATSSKMTIRIPQTTFSDEVGNGNVLSLVQKFGIQTMTIYNAILSEKRVFFLGFDRPAGELSSYVLSAICLVCPPFTGLIANSFPYTNLCYLDFLTVPGFIAGVSNPVFEERGEWWDVMCNIQTGRVTVNPRLAGVFPDPSLAEIDSDLLEEVEFYKSSHFGEDKIRGLFQKYTQNLSDFALGNTSTFSLSSNGTSQLSKVNAQQARVKAWMATSLYHRYTAEQERIAKSSNFANPGDIIKGVFKLKNSRNLSDDETISILKLFSEQIKTEPQIMEFLSYLPEADGGLFPVAVSLFHSSEVVRNLAKDLMGKISSVEYGDKLVKSFDLFLTLGYERTQNSSVRATKEQELREFKNLKK